MTGDLDSIHDLMNRYGADFNALGANNRLLGVCVARALIRNGYDTDTAVAAACIVVGENPHGGRDALTARAMSL